MYPLFERFSSPPKLIQALILLAVEVQSPETSPSTEVTAAIAPVSADEIAPAPAPGSSASSMVSISIGSLALSLAAAAFSI